MDGVEPIYGEIREVMPIVTESIRETVTLMESALETVKDDLRLAAVLIELFDRLNRCASQNTFNLLVTYQELAQERARKN